MNGLQGRPARRALVYFVVGSLSAAAVWSLLDGYSPTTVVLGVAVGLSMSIATLAFELTRMDE